MFLLIGAFLTAFALFELNRTNADSKVYIFSIIALTIALAFRYGQGTDYYPYLLQYETLNASGELFVNALSHGEIGWYILMMLFKRLGLDFTWFIGAIAVISMFSTFYAVKEYSSLRSLSVLLLFPTYYMTYYYSAVRQGLVLSLFLALGLKWLLKKDYLHYYLWIAALSLIHTSAIMLAFIPLIYFFEKRGISNWLIVVIVATAVFGYSGLLNRVATALGVQNYFSVSFSYLAILLRMILGYFAYRMHSVIVEHDRCNNIENTLYHIYIFGLIIYLSLSFTSTLSQRATMPLKAVEILLFPMQISIINGLRKNTSVALKVLKINHYSVLLISLVIVMIPGIELYKNLSAYIGQGNYYSWVHPWNYPYVSIFDADRIFNYIYAFKL